MWSFCLDHGIFFKSLMAERDVFCLFICAFWREKETACKGIGMLKPNVLRRKKDFSTIYQKGKSIGTKYVVLFYKRNQLPYNRTAFLASKKVGNAVTRNRARRLLKESYRQVEEKMTQGYDLIFIARTTIVDVKCKDVKKAMDFAIAKSGILRKR